MITSVHVADVGAARGPGDWHLIRFVAELAGLYV
jgi:hypothetical protein